MARLHTETIPTSTLAATARVVDGFVTTQTDHQGITSSFTRAYTVTGVTLTATDGRGNTATTHTDLAGRSISRTDAAGNTTATVYDAAFDAPSVITNAQGKTACYKYDLRGRKVAEWGTAIQSPRRLVGGLDKCAAFAPKGRGRNGVRPSQSDRGLGESLDKRAAFARRGEGAMGCARVNIGNRKTAQEAAEEATAYDANNLNQYISIQEGTAEAFVPTFDADGNQTKVQTSTGIWNVVYNAENRPVTFTSEDGATVVECTYDKAPDGRKGDWTNAQHLPEGRGAVRRLRVNICEVRYNPHGIHLHALRLRDSHGQRHATHPVEQRIQRQQARPRLLQLPSLQPGGWEMAEPRYGSR